MSPATRPSIGGVREGPALDVVGQARWVPSEFQSLLSDVPEPVIRLLGALIVVLLGWYLSRLIVQFFGRSLAQRFRRPSVARTVLRSVRVLVLAISVISGLAILGFRFGDILISVTVFSAVIGIILAPIVGSIINGVFVLADRPYEIGDMIELADSGTRGFVEDVTLRYTKVFTLDNSFIVIPNSSIRERDVINYSAEDERTRLSLELLVTYEGDLEEARRLSERAARDVEDVITGGPDIRVGGARYPASPTCYIDEFADHGVRLTLRYWAREPYKLPRVRSKVQERVWDALDDANVEIAYPHQHLVFDDTSGEARVALGSRPDGERPVRRRATDPVERQRSTGGRGGDETERGSGPGTDATDPDAGTGEDGHETDE